MTYGYFDNEKREYVITSPDTPSAWANYLGSPQYGAIISNNAGGYSFEKSGANGRILRYSFNSDDRPGRYVYLRDNESGDYWSASWQPVGKDLKEYKSECRHGTGYTVISSEYSSVSCNVSYYVPIGKEYEVWHVEVKNDGDVPRNLTVTGFAEFTNNPNYEQDGVNLQYSQFISRTQFKGNRIRQILHGNMLGNDADNGNRCEERFFAIKGQAVDSFCGDLEEFTGRYRSLSNPAGVESGNLGNKLNYCKNSCGALSAVIKLKPGQSEEMDFLLGQKSDADAQAIIENHTDGLDEVRRFWHEKLDRFKVETPSGEFNSMVNTWNAFNCFITFTWSRAASFFYCGLRNGFGYRDTVQDIQGVIHLAPDEAKNQLEFMLSAQVSNGAGLPLVKYTHNPGHEDTPDDESYVRETGHPAYRADDALWLFPTVKKYICESGERQFLDETIPYADRNEASVYEHLKKAIDFTMNHLGPHGLPAGLHADWNDCLRLGQQGESSFVAMQFYYALGIMEEFAGLKGIEEDIKYFESLKNEFAGRIRQTCFDSDRFIRGYTQDGEAIGACGDSRYDLWLNPQSWSIISGLADEDESRKAMDLVYSRLNSKYGAVIMDPPFTSDAFEGALARIYNAGAKENASIFSQTQGWLVLAEALRNNGNRAFEYYIENCPAAQNSDADVSVMEPY